MAQKAATLALPSDGRFSLGVGAGEQLARRCASDREGVVPNGALQLRARLDAVLDACAARHDYPAAQRVP